jgi:DNA-binding transcriptional ArsR family regulator
MERGDFRSQARLMKALGNEARLMIVDRLGEGECSAGDLTRMVGLDQSTVSKHLAVLRAHGIVEDRREGSVVIYQLVMPCVTNFFSCAAQAVRERKWGPTVPRKARSSSGACSTCAPKSSSRGGTASNG